MVKDYAWSTPQLRKLDVPVRLPSLFLFACCPTRQRPAVNANDPASVRRWTWKASLGRWMQQENQS